jgi:Ser/Thr protein kinase RdoA (MazF antagonist)
LLDAASVVLGSPDRLDAVFLTHGEREWNRIAILLFAPQSTTPTAVLKIARRPALNLIVEGEHQHLQEISSAVDRVLQQSLPSSVLFHWKDLAVAIESCVPGATLNSRTGAPARELLQDLQLATAWLARFHHATSEMVPARAWMTRRLVGELCPEYAATFGLTDAERHLFRLAAARLEALGPLQLPIVWQHADFGPWNVYRHQTQVSVIDWEGARRGPALSDLLYFTLHWSMQVTGTATSNARLKQFEALFCGGLPSEPFHRAILTEVAAYTRQTHLRDALIPLLLLYTVLEQAVDLARRHASFGPPAAGSRADNPYVGYVRVLARHAHRLLGSEARYAA